MRRFVKGEQFAAYRRLNRLNDVEDLHPDSTYFRCIWAMRGPGPLTYPKWKRHCAKRPKAGIILLWRHVPQEILSDGIPAPAQGPNGERAPPRGNARRSAASGLQLENQ